MIPQLHIPGSKWNKNGSAHAKSGLYARVSSGALQWISVMNSTKAGTHNWRVSTPPTVTQPHPNFRTLELRMVSTRGSHKEEPTHCLLCRVGCWTASHSLWQAPRRQPSAHQMFWHHNLQWRQAPILSWANICLKPLWQERDVRVGEQAWSHQKQFQQHKDILWRTHPGLQSLQTKQRRQRRQAQLQKCKPSNQGQLRQWTLPVHSWNCTGSS